MIEIVLTARLGPHRFLLKLFIQALYPSSLNDALYLMLSIRVMVLPILSCNCLCECPCECLCEINQLPFLPALFNQRLFIRRPFYPAPFFIQRLFVRRFFEPNAV